MGVVWDQMVQSVKKALQVVLKISALRDLELLTLMAEVEFIFNSRPLKFVSGDALDPESPTPNYFLLGRNYRVAAVRVFDDKDHLLRKQWRISQRLANHFGKDG